MFSPGIVVAILLVYIGVLFIIALWVERNPVITKKVGNSPLIYSLSLAVYCTAWTFYGGVGAAATSGLLFLTIYLGPTLSIIFWWTILRKLVRIKNRYHITSIADFISARYNKSQLLAVIATCVVFVGSLPYIALQLKAIISTFGFITHSPAAAVHQNNYLGPIVVTGMIMLTILIGMRRLDPTERHPGIMVVLTIQSIVKLIAFIAVGIFVTYFMYNGFSDIFQRIPLMTRSRTEAVPYTMWVSYLILSMSAIMFLPRQFHVSVIENSDEKHIRTAMWAFPLYMLLMNIFVYPIAMASLLKGYPVREADIFVLKLPQDVGRYWLGLLVFMGGFSAAIGMIMINSIAVAIMVTNHLMLFLIEGIKQLGFLRKHLLKCRWLVVAGYLFLGYWFEQKVGTSYMLANIGMISFAAVLQFAPVIIGGLFWRKGNRRGAILGLSAGFLVWFYTLLIPSFVKSGWLAKSIINGGPWGIGLLNPERLFGITALDPLSHGVFWSMAVNISVYILGSLYFTQAEEEKIIAADFVGILSPNTLLARYNPKVVYNINLAEKRKIVEGLLVQYFPAEETTAITGKCLSEIGINNKDRICIMELADLNSTVEKYLAGSVGSAVAHKAIEQSHIFTPEEVGLLSQIYGKMVGDLKLTPKELKSKIDYYQEKEELSVKHALELEERVDERTADLVKTNDDLKLALAEREKAEAALQESKQRLSDIINFSPDATFVIDIEGKVIAWNKAIEEMSGVKAEDILGKGDCEYSLPFYGDRRPMLIDLVNRHDAETEEKYPFIKNDKGVLTTEIFLPNFREKGIFVWGKATPLYDVNGKVTGAIESIRDITERKRAEESLAEYARQLSEINRELDDFTYIVSHDLKEPLRSINAFSNFLSTDYRDKLEEEGKNYLERIRINATRMQNLIDDLLAISRIERKKNPIEEVEVGDLVNEVKLRLEYAIQQKHAELVINSTLPRIFCDKVRLTEVFLNLVSNAVKFNDKAAPRIEVGWQLKGDFYEFYVRDNGPGIEERYFEKIFMIFQRLVKKEDYEGTGAGLTIAKKVVEMHGGKIWVESKVGEGTTFYFTIPVKKEGMTGRKRLGEILIESKLVTEEDVIGALKKQGRILETTQREVSL